MFLNLLAINAVNDSIASTHLSFDDNPHIRLLLFLLTVALIIAGVLIYHIYFAKESKNHKFGVEENTPEDNDDDDDQEPDSFTPPIDVTPPNTKGNGDTDISDEQPEKGPINIPKDTGSEWSHQTGPSTTGPGTTTPPPHPPQIVNPPDPLKDYQIGFTPATKFKQPEQYFYPFVAMPEPESLVKPPQKGKTGRKGYTEENFRTYLCKYFNKGFLINDTDSLVIKNKAKPYEPDFSLVGEKNIFIDIEIDEPYEGNNNIKKRKPTHYQGADSDRNKAFTERGWIVIRFAEIQIHQAPLACCRFIADVLKTINPDFTIPDTLKDANKLQPVQQWTKDEAKKMSIEKYREKYLGITRFGITTEKAPNTNIIETSLGSEIEDRIEQEKTTKLNPTGKETPYNYIQDLISSAIHQEYYLSIVYEGSPKIVKPLRISSKTALTAYCFITNGERTFSISNISNVAFKNSFYTDQFVKPDRKQVESIFNNARGLKQVLRIKYAPKETLDKETGELISSETKYFTISNMKPVEDGVRRTSLGEINVYKEIHFDAVSHTFNNKPIFLRFDKICEIEVLNLEI